MSNHFKSTWDPLIILLRPPSVPRPPGSVCQHRNNIQYILKSIKIVKSYCNLQIFHNILIFTLFYYIFDQVNAALVRIRDFFQKRKKSYQPHNFLTCVISLLYLKLLSVSFASLSPSLFETCNCRYLWNYNLYMGCASARLLKHRWI